jgi:hypothetical protein
LGELAEKHGYEMIPAAEAFGMSLGLMMKDQVEKLSTMKQSHQLTEQTCLSYHRFASLFWLTVFCRD